MVVWVVVVFVLFLRVGDYQFVAGLSWEEEVGVRPLLLDFVHSLLFYHCALGNVLLLQGGLALRLEVVAFFWSLTDWLWFVSRLFSFDSRVVEAF